MIKIDIRELEAYQKLVEQKAKDVDAFMLECVGELGARLEAKVRKRTPTGDTASHMENRVDADGNPLTYKRGEKKGKAKQHRIIDHTGGTLRRGWKSSEPVKVGDTYSITVSNDVDYAQYVEYGHRQQIGRYVPAIGKKLKKGWVEGKFMLTRSEAELQRELDSIINKKIKTFLGDL